MSSIRVKTKYLEEGTYGSEIERTLYAVHSNSSDYVSVYDEDGTMLFCFNDTVRNNMFDAIVRVAGVMNAGEYPEGVELMDDEDCKKIGL